MAGFYVPAAGLQLPASSMLGDLVVLGRTCGSWLQVFQDMGSSYRLTDTGSSWLFICVHVMNSEFSKPTAVIVKAVL